MKSSLIVVVVFVVFVSVAEAAPVLYGITGAGHTPSSLYTVDPVTGAATLVGATGYSHIVGIDFDPTDGTLYGMLNEYNSYNDGALITINTSTAAVSIVGAGSTRHHVPDITIGSDGVLRGWTEGSIDFVSDVPVTFDKNTGAPILVAPNGVGTALTGIATASSSTIYVKSNAYFYEVDVTTGASTFLFNVGQTLDNMLENAPGGLLLTADRTGTGTQFYSVDPSDGSLTALGFTTGIQFAGLAYTPDVTQVPEPGTLGLLMFGLFGLAAAARRRRKFEV